MSANQPTRRSILHTLRVALALLSFTLGIFFVCLWVRSQFCIDELHVGIRRDRAIWGHTRPDGLRIHYNKLRNPADQSWRWRYIRPEEQAHRSPIFPWEYNKQVLGFACTYGPNGWSLAIPFWFLTLTTAVAAILLTPKPRWQFSLRRLLAVVTLVAVLLSLVVALAKHGH